jgi:hypothetical protein
MDKSGLMFFSATYWLQSVSTFNPRSLSRSCITAVTTSVILLLATILIALSLQCSVASCEYTRSKLRLSRNIVSVACGIDHLAWVSGVKTRGRILGWQTRCLSTLQFVIGQAPVKYELLYNRCDPAFLVVTVTCSYEHYYSRRLPAPSAHISHFLPGARRSRMTRRAEIEAVG